MNRVVRFILLASAPALSACLATPQDRSAFQRTSAKPFDQVAACMFSTLTRAYPGRPRFTDANRSGSVRIRLDDNVQGVLGPAPRQVEITVVQSGSGATIDLVSPTFHAEPIWEEVGACA